MSKQEVRIKWEARIQEFRNSGLSAAEWCRVHHLNVNQFRRWIHKFPVQDIREETSPAIRWLSVKTRDLATPTASAPTITIRIGAAHIEVRDGFNPALLKQVIQALAE